MTKRSIATRTRVRRQPEPTAATKPSDVRAHFSWLIAAALVATVFVVYQPAWHGRFLWDDDLHLLNNPVLKPGGLARAWTPGSYINYWPLTFTVYRLEFQAWGLAPLGFHLVNIALHALTAILVWRFLVELDVPGALLAAALFALHPVNVESVAWIAQLKGLLSLLFAVLSALLYLEHDRRGGWKRYAAALTAFSLSTLAKGMVITLPVVLLFCAWWRRGTIGRRDLARILPYVLIGAIMAGVEVWGQQMVLADSVRSDSLPGRFAVAGCAVWFYLGKLLWPFNLCFVYPRWQIDDGAVLSYLPGLLLVIVLALAWWRRRTWGRPVVMLLVCYVALLLPALGFVNIYFTRYSLVADHWQYAAMIVPCAVLAGVVAAWTVRQPRRRPVAYGVGAAVLAALACLTWQQSQMYAEAETLYHTTLELNPDCWFAHNNLGIILAGRGQVDEAIRHFQKALELKRDYLDAYTNLGNALAGRGQVDDAIAQYQKALEINPDDPVAHNYLGLALASCKRVDKAMYHYRKALESRPDYAIAHNNLGVLLTGLNRVDDAMAEYEMALEIKPDYADAHNNLGGSLAGRGRVDEAIGHYRKALETKHDFLDAHYNLAVALAGYGKVDEALTHYRKALDLAIDRKDKALADRIRAQISRLQP